MGWFDGWFGPTGASQSDPLRKLDPKLREFLEKESPVKYSPAEATPQQSATAPTIPERNRVDVSQPAAAAPQESVVPRESIYQDGRYAHIWKTYRPQAAIEAESKSDHEKLMDVLDGFKDRKVEIGKAALENCALEQEDWRDCMTNGSAMERFTMCREKVMRFEKCYEQQARLLKALGYLSQQARSPEVDEKIQLHADKLYHRMLEQEAAIAKARKDGVPAPEFASMFDKPKATENKPEPGDPAGLSEEAKKQWKSRLDKVPEETRDAEEAAMRAELRAKAEMAARVQDLWQEQAKQREARKTEGKETVSDKVSSWFGTQKK